MTPHSLASLRGRTEFSPQAKALAEACLQEYGKRLSSCVPADLKARIEESLAADRELTHGSADLHDVALAVARETNTSILEILSHDGDEVELFIQAILRERRRADDPEVARILAHIKADRALAHLTTRDPRRAKQYDRLRKAIKSHPKEYQQALRLFESRNGQVSD